MICETEGPNCRFFNTKSFKALETCATNVSFVPLENVPIAKTSYGIDMFFLIVTFFYNYSEEIITF
jgi:hypothetical protein